MTDLEALQSDLAEAIYSALNTYATSDDRSAQAGRWQVGISDLGWCSERTRRMLNQETPDDTDMLAAFIGTAVGDHAERAIAASHAFPDALVQESVRMVLRGQQRTYAIPGHPDVILKRGIVLDGKTADGLMVAERTGMEERQKKFQRHGYGLAAFEANMFDPDVTLDDVLVGNFWIDRSGAENRVLVRVEPYDPEVTQETLDWLEEVIYSFQQGEPARKEPPREMCAKTCGFFTDCRAFDTDVSGLITDPDHLTALTMYSEGKDLASLGRKMQEQAKSTLRGTEGWALVGDKKYALRWTHVNEVMTAPSIRRAHDKIELKEV